MRNDGLDERWLARLEKPFTLLGLNTANRTFLGVAAINAVASIIISVDLRAIWLGVDTLRIPRLINCPLELHQRNPTKYIRQESYNTTILHLVIVQPLTHIVYFKVVTDHRKHYHDSKTSVDP